MAEGKKSFVLYVDQKTTIDQLPDDVAGKLLKHIYAYCNDENPVTDDLLLNIAFEPIKQTFKRDLKRYKDRADRSRVNGTKGGRPKKPKKPSGLINNPSEPKKPDSVSVSDSDSVSVSDSVSNILLEKETKELFKVWIDYRKEIKKVIKSDKTLITLAKRIQKEGYEKAKQVIYSSIENGYQGLFWDKSPPKQNQPELIDGYRNPVNGKININELTKKLNGTTD